MSKPSYIQGSKQAASRLQPDIVGAIKPDKPIGYGSTATVFALGTVQLGSTALPLCLKLSKRRDATDLRFIHELATTNLICTKAPDLRHLFPRFMSLLAIDRPANTVGILTEDLTRSGELCAIPIPARPETLLRVQDALASKPGERLITGSATDSVAFDVDGAEKWLDLTPPPIFVTDSHADATMRYRKRIEREIPDLTCTIAADSLLAMFTEQYQC